MRMAARGCFAFLFISALAFTPKAKAENDYQFRHYGMESGLSQNTVYAITQDKMGFMWFGTKNGLNRFDGHNIKAFYHSDDDNALHSDDINALATTEDGTLWIGCSTGLYVYDYKTESFQHFLLKSDDGQAISSNIVSLIPLGNDVLIATNRQGMFFYNKKNDKLVHNNFAQHNTITSMAIDSKQRVWISFFGEGLYYTDTSLKEEKPMLDNEGHICCSGISIKGIIPTEQEQIFIGTDGNGVAELNLNTLTITPIMPNVTDNGKFVHALSRRGNEIVAATEGGIYIYEMLTHELQHYQYEPTNPFSLSDNSTQSLFCDQQGGIWVGTSTLR